MSDIAPGRGLGAGREALNRRRGHISCGERWSRIAEDQQGLWPVWLRVVVLGEAVVSAYFAGISAALAAAALLLPPLLICRIPSKR
ncbi:hypothetical protein PABY_08440 [Pyrodictium abyssi]|uniref:Uncharacterized protein n=1 Tax=Pyrodictium abyssi TaxID=54256 RepID=A0ABN6ZT47_9CREN|nr:hypothetical protein PABY_08440 [Pyrodictium abyssi]